MPVVDQFELAAHTMVLSLKHLGGYRFARRGVPAFGPTQGRVLELWQVLVARFTTFVVVCHTISCMPDSTYGMPRVAYVPDTVVRQRWTNHDRTCHVERLRHGTAHAILLGVRRIS